MSVDILEIGRVNPKTKSKGIKRKAGAPTSTTTQNTSNKKVKKFTWASEKVEHLLRYIQEYKSNCEFRGVDFEADLAIMYQEVRKRLAQDYPQEFGPEKVSHSDIDITGMNKEQ